jgi:hypothetical protein
VVEKEEEVVEKEEEVIETKSGFASLEKTNVALTVSRLQYMPQRTR